MISRSLGTSVCFPGGRPRRFGAGGGVTGKPDRRQVGKSVDALTQITEVGSQLVRSADLTRPVGWQLKPAFDIFSYRLRIAAGARSDRRDRDSCR